MLDANRKPNVTFGNACARLLFGRELGMCRAGRVNGERACVTDIGDVIEHLEAINEFAASIAAVSKLEADQATVAAREICVGAAFHFTGHQAREDDLCDLRVFGEVPDNLFDAVTLQFASRHLEIIRAFKEIYRVLKPGGIFCHNDMLRPASKVVELPYLVYLRFSVWFTAMIFGSSPESKKCVGYFTNAIRHFYTPCELAMLLGGVGFARIETCDFLTGVLTYHISRKPKI